MFFIFGCFILPFRDQQNIFWWNIVYMPREPAIKHIDDGFVFGYALGSDGRQNEFLFKCFPNTDLYILL